jgi:hypothetical protein
MVAGEICDPPENPVLAELLLDALEAWLEGSAGKPKPIPDALDFVEEVAAEVRD